MSQSRTGRASWVWTLAAYNGVAATVLHLALAGVATFDVLGAYRGLATFAHFGALAALLAIVPWTVQQVGAPRAALTVATIVFGSLLLVVVVNAKVYALYKFHLNAMVWFLLTQGAALQTLAFSAQMWAGAIAIAIGAFGVEGWFAMALSRRGGSSRRALGLYAASILSLGIATQCIHAYADATAQRALLMAVRTIPWAQPLTAKRFLARLGYVAPKSDAPDLAVQSAGTFAYPLARLECTGGARPNIVMIVVDSLRFDMLTPDVMPRTSAWANSATHFTRHYSTGNGTRFGIFGLMYGLPGAYWHAALAERRGPVLIDQLDALDYQFFVFGSAPLDSPEFHRTAFTRIWDRVAPNGPGGVAERDRAITRGLIDAIASRDASRPFFAFYFLDAPHAYAHPADMRSPFTPMLESVNYLELDNSFDPLPFVNAYKTSVLFDDGLIGQLLDALAADPRLADTIVAVTGDHGQAFNETHDNTWGHNSNFSDYEVRVPFVVRWPGRAPEVVDRPTSHVDWAPTLLTDALGCTTPVDRYSTGASLFAGDANDRVLPIEQWTQRAVRTRDRAYVFLSWGGYEVRDANYALVSESVDGNAVRVGFEQLSRFMRR
jgi:membrane-anchored protein YejM (alkaline phosphatase superfamily)